MKIIIDGNKFDSSLELHLFIAQSLNFPDYYGKNLDALYDCLMDIDVSITIIFSNMQKYKAILTVFEDASKFNKNIVIEVQM